MIDVKNSAPMKMLKKYNYLYPPAWNFAEDIAADKDNKDMWPHEYVFIPIEAGLEYESIPPQGEYHKAPSMHIRRAHWHTFLYGEKKSKRRLKWLPPIIVNDTGKDFITVTNVKKK